MSENHYITFSFGMGFGSNNLADFKAILIPIGIETERDLLTFIFLEMKDGSGFGKYPV
jgi:acetoacetate decarboxylase